MQRYSFSAQGLIVKETDSRNGWCKELVTGNKILMRELVATANLALEYRAAAKARREDPTNLPAA